MCKRVRIAAALLLSAILASDVGAQDVDIDRDWQVVYPSPEMDEMSGTMLAATEVVCDCLEETLGFRPTAVPSSRAKKPCRTIWIGGVFAERDGVMPKDFKGYDNGIAVRNGDIYLYGRDRVGRHPRSHWRHDLMPSYRAAMRFLEKFAGARFVLPGRVGREYVRRDKVSVPADYTDRETPSFECDHQRVFDTAYHQANGLIGAGGYFLYGGHTYPVACPWDKYHETHPEYFALRGGLRAKGPTKHQQALCISNPDVEELIVQELERRLDAGAEVCELGQNDGSVICECERCKAMFGTGDDWGEKLWCFHRRIAERVLKDRPDKRLLLMSYAATAEPPKTFREFPANVMIELCGYTEADFSKWSAYKVPNGFTVYLYLWGDYPMPGFTAKRSFAGFVRLLERLRRNHVRGIYRCGFGELQGMEGAQYYVFSRLVANPKADVLTLLDEFCKGAFGAASEPMRRFYLTLDGRLRAFDLMSDTYSESSGPLGGLGAALPKDPLDLLAFTYPASVLQELEGSLSAATAVVGLTEKQRKRLDLVRVEFEYTKNLATIATLYAAYRTEPTEESFRPLAAALQKRKAMLDRLFEGKEGPQPVKGWKGLSLFGGAKRSMVETNGRLGAKIGAPLNWDVERFLKDGMLPGPTKDIAKWKKYNADRGLKPLEGWHKSTGGCYAADGTFALGKDGTSFSLTPGTNADVRVATKVTSKQGIKPGTRYRLSWFAKLNDVRSLGKSGGFYVVAFYDRYPAYVTEPSDRPLTGTTEWVHQSTEFTTCKTVGFESEVAFRIYNAHGTVQVEDVTLEELGRTNAP